jgi:hypothetical protein
MPQEVLITTALRESGADKLATHIIQRYAVLSPEAIQLTAVLASPRWRDSFDPADRDAARELEREIRSEATPDHGFGHGSNPVFDWISLLHYRRPWREPDLLRWERDLAAVEVFAPAASRTADSWLDPRPQLGRAA